MGDNRINSRQSTRGVKVAESEVICICVCLCVFMGGGEGVGAALSWPVSTCQVCKGSVTRLDLQGK